MLTESIIKNKILEFKKIASTNLFAQQHIQNLQDKTIILADIQTAGKGRNNRSWFSQKNNLFTSIILKPKYDFSVQTTLSSLTQYTAIILTRVFEKKYKILAKIKWPNDILIDGKKIAGILIETIIKGAVLEGIIVGVGVNLNLEKKFLDKIDQPATSLNILLNKNINRDEFLNLFLQEFFDEYEKLLQNGFLLIKEEYIAKNMFLNKKVKAVVFDKIYEGIAIEIDDEGRLILDCKEKKEIVNIGDIIC